MHIRVLDETDISRCGEIYSSAFSVPPYNDSWTQDAAEVMLEGLLQRDHENCWCLEVGDVIVGFVFCTVFGSFRATIQEIAVSPEYQCLGHGSALIEYALTQFNMKGITAIDLVANRNAPAYRLYRKFSFVEPKDYRIMIRIL
ncbi:MAG: GNAT family N-acetyltransferase [Armatimonadota bacterium]